MASLPRLELPRGHRLLLLDDRERDAPVVGIRAGRHHALEHLVGKRLVRQDGDLALGDIALAHLLADQHRPLERCAQRLDESVVPVRIWSTVAMNSPCTKRSVFVIITTTDCLGAVSAIDCGISMPLAFWMTSTSVE